MRELQGGIITSSLFIIFLGISGLLTALLRFISPVTGGPPEFSHCVQRWGSCQWRADCHLTTPALCWHAWSSSAIVK